MAIARGAGVLAGEELTGTDLYVIVRPFQWQRLSLGHRKTLGLAEACRLKTGFYALTVRFRYDREGADILKLSRADLLDLGRSRFVAEPAKGAPAGFLGLPWGAAPPAGLKSVGGGHGATVWISTAKLEPFLGVTPSDRDYTFDRRRLFGGDLYFKNAPAIERLKAALAVEYGPPSSAELNGDQEIYRWSWKSKEVEIQFSVDQTKNEATLNFQKK